MVKAIIVSHGDFAAECLNSITSILGKVDNVAALSNAAKSLDSLREHIEDHLPRDDSDAIIFVDLFGSNYTAGKMSGRGYPVISGFNLPMLVSFFTKRDQLELNELVKTVVSDGKRGIKSEQYESTSEDE